MPIVFGLCLVACHSTPPPPADQTDMDAGDMGPTGDTGVVGSTGTTGVTGMTGSTGDLIAPTVTAITPSDDASGVALSATVTVTFSESMDTATLTAVSLDPDEPALRLYDDTSHALTITPLVPLSPGRVYVVHVGTGAQDVAGNPLAQASTTVFFTTATETRLDDGGAAIPYSFNLARANDGSALALWAAPSPSGTALRFAATTGATGSWSTPVDLALISDNATLIAGADRFVVAHAETAGLVAHVLTHSGNSWSDASSTRPLPGGMTITHVAGDARGNTFYLAWSQDDGSVWVDTYATGAWLPTGARVQKVPGEQSRNLHVLASANNAVLAWEQKQSAQVQLQASINTSGSWPAPVLVQDAAGLDNSYNTELSVAALAGGDDFILAWRQDDPATPHVRATIYGASGATFSGSTDLESATPGPIVGDVSTAATADTFVVVWGQSASTGPAAIFAATETSSGWDATTQLSTVSVSYYNNNVGAAGGRFFATWQQEGHNHGRIFANSNWLPELDLSGMFTGATANTPVTFGRGATIGAAFREYSIDAKTHVRTVTYYDADDAAGPTGVVTTVTLDTATEASGDPVAVSSPQAGGFVVGWPQDIGFAFRFGDAAGFAPSGSSFDSNCGPVDAGEVALSSQGDRAAIVWTQRRGMANRLLATIAASGAVSTSTVFAGADNMFVDAGPATVTQSAGWTYVFQQTATSAVDINVLAFGHDGSAWQSPAQLDSNGFSWHMAAAGLASAALLATQAPSGVAYDVRVFRGADGIWDAGTVVATVASPTYYTTAARDNDAVLAWTDAGALHALYYDDVSRTWSNDTVLASNVLQFDLSAGPAGYAVLWSDFSALEAHGAFMTGAPGSTSWTAELIASNTDGGIVHGGVGTQTQWASWMENGQVHCARRAAATTWDTNTVFGATGDVSTLANAAVVGDRFFVAYSDDSGGQVTVRGASVAPGTAPSEVALFSADDAYPAYVLGLRDGNGFVVAASTDDPAHVGVQTRFYAGDAWRSPHTLETHAVTPAYTQTRAPGALCFLRPSATQTLGLYCLDRFTR